ncbi:unnamed protein product [Closterium sp. NIES-65]|nr:unnamed protein product [Closterium sp. NIES-65]
MRGDLCSHAEGTLIPELQRQGLRIPLQPVPVIDDNGYICVDPPVDIRRELLDHKEKFAVIEHDIQVLTAKIEYLAIRKGVTSDELDAGARQHLGAVVDTLVESATPRKHAKADPTADRSNPGRVASSGRVGVMWNAEKQRYYVPIISARRQQVRLGSYEDKDEASYAYAAGAVVLRPNSRISCTVELSDGDRQALAGCTEEILRLLVKYRRWNRWREWRAAMAGLNDAQAVETRSRRKGRASRASSDIEEVQAITQTTEDQPMAEEPEDRTEDYTDDDESVDDDAVAVDAEAACTPIVANAPQGEEDTEAVKEHLIDELMEGKDEDDEEGNGGGQSSSNDPCGENGSEEEQATKVPHSRKRIDAADGQVTRVEFDALRDSQIDTAKTLARLESHVLTIIRLRERRKRKRASTSAAASLGREALKRKRQSDDDEESTCDEDDLPAKVARHARHDKSSVLQTALDILPAEKAWKERDLATMDARHGVTMFRKLNVLVGDGVVGDGVVGWWETGWWGGGRRGGGMVGDGVVLGKACTSHFIISSPSCPSMTSLSFQALGMVASMSYFTCSACSNCATIIGHGGAHHAAAHLPGLLQPRCWISFLAWQRWVANTVASKAAAPLLSASIRLLKRRREQGRPSPSRTHPVCLGALLSYAFPTPAHPSFLSSLAAPRSTSCPLALTAHDSAHEARPAESLRQEEQLRASQGGSRGGKQQHQHCAQEQEPRPHAWWPASHGVAELLPNTPLTRKQRAYVMEDHHPHVAGDNVLKISSGVLLRRLKICG